jgi:hypothetical protein
MRAGCDQPEEHTLTVTFFLIFWLGGAHVAGTIARNKGYRYAPFFAGALLMMILVLPYALLMKPDDDFLCPHCRSLVTPGATVCAKCTHTYVS